MTKKTVSKIAAIALAGLTTFSTMGVAASATTTVNKDAEIYGTVDVLTISLTTTTTSYDAEGKITSTTTTTENLVVNKYYDSTAQANAAYTKYVTDNPKTNVAKPALGTPGDAVTYTYGKSIDSGVKLSTLFAPGATVDIDETGLISAGSKWTVVASGATTTPGTGTGSTSGGVYSEPAAAYKYADTNVYYSKLNNCFYPNLKALQSVEGIHSNYTVGKPSTPYSSTNCYFNVSNGSYVSYKTDYTYLVTGPSSTTTTQYGSYKVGSYYYSTYAEAYAAANNNANLITTYSTYTTVPNNYFSNVTGAYYSTYSAALYASNGNAAYVDVFNGASTYYDYYDYLYGYSNYTDPYYYYWMNKNYGTSSSNKDTTTATIGKKTGWTTIAKYLKNISNGSSTTVDMNNETVVPSSVLSAIKGRNITVKFVLDNGVTFTVNGKDVTTAKDIDLDTTYNTKSISKKLIKAAYKKNDAVSSAQLSIDAGSLGFNADLTVKFSTKRSGYKAKIYRYNSARNTLQLVDTATIGSTGKCTFDNITKGGEFVVVLYK
ncbi:MAG: hypothetical protein J6K17_10210 [Oscillospiraceae bacterium]|nr:hypothetical protein [Oscillospiraceae bacterium]